MSAKIEEFLIELSKDPYRTAEFRKNPESGLEGLNFTPDEINVLTSADPEELAATLHVARKPSMGGTKPKPKPKPKK